MSMLDWELVMILVSSLISYGYRITFRHLKLSSGSSFRARPQRLENKLGLEVCVSLAYNEPASLS